MRFTNDALWPIKRFRMHNPSAHRDITLSFFFFYISFSFFYLSLILLFTALRPSRSMYVSYDYARNKPISRDVVKAKTFRGFRPSHQTARSWFVN